jgi:hypothetical protein
VEKENHALVELASLLGYAGVVPFIAGATLTWLPSGTFEFLPRHWPLLSYSAVILTFMGAIHWGLAMHNAQATPQIRAQLLLSTVPSLIAWIALGLPVSFSYPLLAFAFVLMLYGDARALAFDLVPQWYAKLRGPLTFVALLALVFAWGGEMLVD